MADFFTHDTYIGVFTWRYGSDAMRGLWSETRKRRLWRRLWIALAEAQGAAGLVTIDQITDLRAHADDIDIYRAEEIEAEIHHDLMAEIRVFAEQCPIGAGIIHMGATSADIEDNADALRIRDGLALLIERLRDLLGVLADQIDRHAERQCMAYTHLQPAEPTTVGYRMAVYAQDLLHDWYTLNHLREGLRGKGIKGPVGTAASYAELLRASPLSPADLEAHVMESIGLKAYTVTGQTYPRRQDWDVVTALAGIGLSIHRMAFDVRILQSPLFGEWAEPFGSSQVGSSAMPFKRNPIQSESMDSLARLLASLPEVAWHNAANHLLERTLDDSANRRIMLPQAFLITDELLIRAVRVIGGLTMNEEGIRRNVQAFGHFAATERLLMEAARRGGNRQEWHAIIREHSMADEVRSHPERLVQTLAADPRVLALFSAEEVAMLGRIEAHIGDAPERARAMAREVREATQAM